MKNKMRRKTPLIIIIMGCAMLFLVPTMRRGISLVRPKSEVCVDLLRDREVAVKLSRVRNEEELYTILEDEYNVTRQSIIRRQGGGGVPMPTLEWKDGEWEYTALYYEYRDGFNRMERYTALDNKGEVIINYNVIYQCLGPPAYYAVRAPMAGWKTSLFYPEYGIIIDFFRHRAPKTKLLEEPSIVSVKFYHVVGLQAMIEQDMSEGGIPDLSDIQVWPGGSDYPPRK